jgi:hypothetical protein
LSMMNSANSTRIVVILRKIPKWTWEDGS